MENLVPLIPLNQNLEALMNPLVENVIPMAENLGKQKGYSCRKRSFFLDFLKKLFELKLNFINKNYNFCSFF